MRLTVEFNAPRAVVNITGQPAIVNIGHNIVKEYMDDRPYYEGDYTVDPSAHEDIVLATRNLAMRDDITVNKIYYAEVSNLSNGLTAYIAEHE